MDRLSLARIFHAAVAAEWASSPASATELVIRTTVGRRQRVEVGVLDGHDRTFIDAKSTDWDAVPADRVRSNADRHARQLESAMAAAEPQFHPAEDATFGLAIVYPKPPRDGARRADIESTLAERGVTAVWGASPPRPAASLGTDGNGASVQAYCVRDRIKVAMVDPVEITMKNGRPAVQGRCPECGGSLFKIGALGRIPPTADPSPEPTSEERWREVLEHLEQRAARGEIDTLITVSPDGELSGLRAVTASGHVAVTSEAVLLRLGDAAQAYQERERSRILAEFVSLIDAEAVRERDLQEFLESYPEFILGSDYEVAHPHARLRGARAGVSIPDFLLQPPASVTYPPQVVELKRPNQRIVRRDRQHSIYANVMNARDQLLRYQEYFDEEDHRARLSARLGFEVQKPTLVLIVGRALDLHDTALQAKVHSRITPVELMTYDDLAVRWRRRGT